MSKNPAQTVLAIDIGGTKILGALVDGESVHDTVQIPTPGSGDPAIWIKDLLAKGTAWQGRFGRVGAAVTGVVEAGRWSGLNPKTLSIPSGFPLAETLTELTGKPAFAANDAQAAAWGEFAFGAGKGTRTCVFLTVSTGIGGGVVVNGRLLEGLAGHFGQFRSDVTDSAPLESAAAGRWMAEAAREEGHDLDARGVFEAAARGEAWADAIIALSARRIATLCANIGLGLAPEKIIIGGSIGLAPGFIERMTGLLESMPLSLRPVIAPARLGHQAGIVGIADLAASAGK
jgi:N-acylmannosamine kinase/N-acetylmannosamine-6-phosphate 2-epimerase/N-acetylmannosamine kinase